LRAAELLRLKNLADEEEAARKLKEANLKALAEKK
jgi:hypothetical protein